MGATMGSKVRLIGRTRCTTMPVFTICWKRMHLPTLTRSGEPRRSVRKLLRVLALAATAVGLASLGVHEVDAAIVLDENAFPYFGDDPYWKPVATIADPSASSGAVLTTGFRTDPDTFARTLGVRQVLLDGTVGWEYTNTLSLGKSESRPLGVARRDQDGAVFVAAMISNMDEWESIRCQIQPVAEYNSCVYLGRFVGENGTMEWVRSVPYGIFNEIELPNAVHYDASLDRIFVHFDGFSWASKDFYPQTLQLSPVDGGIQGGWPLGIPNELFPRASTIHGDHLYVSGYTHIGFNGEQVRCRGSVNFCSNCYVVKMPKQGPASAEWTRIIRTNKSGNILQCTIYSQSVDPQTGDIVIAGNVEILERISSEAFVAVLSGEDGSMKSSMVISQPDDGSTTTGMSVYMENDRILLSGVTTAYGALQIVDANGTTSVYTLVEQSPFTTFLLVLHGDLQKVLGSKFTPSMWMPVKPWFFELTPFPDREQLLWTGPREYESEGRYVMLLVEDMHRLWGSLTSAVNPPTTMTGTSPIPSTTFLHPSATVGIKPNLENDISVGESLSGSALTFQLGFGLGAFMLVSMLSYGGYRWRKATQTSTLTDNSASKTPNASVPSAGNVLAVPVIMDSNHALFKTVYDSNGEVRTAFSIANTRTTAQSTITPMQFLQRTALSATQYSVPGTWVPNTNYLYIPAFAQFQHGIQFRMLKQIGGGGMATVWLCDILDARLRDLAGGPILVAKVLGLEGGLTDLTDRKLLAWRQELSVGYFLQRHRNIVKTIGYSLSPNTILLPFYELGSLYDLIRKPERVNGFQWTFTSRLELFLDVCRGLAHMHMHGIAHCDVKPDNVLLTRDPLTQKVYGMLSDFGVVQVVNQGKAVSAFEAHVMNAVSFRYAAPEVFQRFRSRGTTMTDSGSIILSGDVYAASMVLYEMLLLKKAWWEIVA